MTAYPVTVAGYLTIDGNGVRIGIMGREVSFAGASNDIVRKHPLPAGRSRPGEGEEYSDDWAQLGRLWTTQQATKLGNDGYGDV